jgi:hypothetical protein
MGWFALWKWLGTDASIWATSIGFFAYGILATLVRGSRDTGYSRPLPRY